MLSPPPRQRSVLQPPRSRPAGLPCMQAAAQPPWQTRHAGLIPTFPDGTERARPAALWRAATPGRADPRPRDTALSQPFPAPPAPPNRGKQALPSSRCRRGKAGLRRACPRSRGRPTRGQTHLERPRLTRRPQPPWGGGGPGPPRRCPSGSRPARAGRRWRHMRSRPRPSSAAAAGGEPQRHRRAARPAGRRPGGAGTAGQRWGAGSAPGPQRPPLGRCGAVRRFAAGPRRFDIPAVGRAASRPAAAAGALPAAPGPGRGTGGRLGRPALAAGSPQGTRGRGRRGHFFEGGGTAAWVNWTKSEEEEEEDTRTRLHSCAEKGGRRR